MRQSSDSLPPNPTHPRVPALTRCLPVKSLKSCFIPCAADGRGRAGGRTVTAASSRYLFAPFLAPGSSVESACLEWSVPCRRCSAPAVNCSDFVFRRRRCDNPEFPFPGRNFPRSPHQTSVPSPCNRAAEGDTPKVEKGREGRCPSLMATV